MILLDTNVVSEPLRPTPDTRHPCCRMDRCPGTGNVILIGYHRCRITRRRSAAARGQTPGRFAGKPRDAGAAAVCRSRAALRSWLHSSLCKTDGEGSGIGARRCQCRWLHRGHRRRQWPDGGHPRHRPLRGCRGDRDKPVAGLKAAYSNAINHRHEQR
jgi:hypothetical protein